MTESLATATTNATSPACGRGRALEPGRGFLACGSGRRLSGGGGFPAFPNSPFRIPNSKDLARKGREGHKAVLNAFEIRQIK